MNDIRAFIAIEMPLQVLQGLDRVIHQLKGPKTKAVRWLQSKGIHLTLKFLGDVKSANIWAIEEVLKKVTNPFVGFDLQVGKIGVFPNLRKPRIIWVGIQAPQNLSDLQKAIDLATQPLGYPGEDRPFSPHLTLGRVSQNASLQEIQEIAESLSSYQLGTLGIVPVDTVTLFRSDLLPAGAVYTPIITVKLSKLT